MISTDLMFYFHFKVDNLLSSHYLQLARVCGRKSCEVSKWDPAVIRCALWSVLPYNSMQRPQMQMHDKKWCFHLYRFVIGLKIQLKRQEEKESQKEKETQRAVKGRNRNPWHVAASQQWCCWWGFHPICSMSCDSDQSSGTQLPRWGQPYLSITLALICRGHLEQGIPNPQTSKLERLLDEENAK